MYTTHFEGNSNPHHFCFIHLLVDLYNDLSSTENGAQNPHQKPGTEPNLNMLISNIDNWQRPLGNTNTAANETWTNDSGLYQAKQPPL